MVLTINNLSYSEIADFLRKHRLLDNTLSDAAYIPHVKKLLELLGESIEKCSDYDDMSVFMFRGTLPNDTISMMPFKVLHETYRSLEIIMFSIMGNYALVYRNRSVLVPVVKSMIFILNGIGPFSTDYANSFKCAAHVYKTAHNLYYDALLKMCQIILDVFEETEGPFWENRNFHYKEISWGKIEYISGAKVTMRITQLITNSDCIDLSVDSVVADNYYGTLPELTMNDITWTLKYDLTDTNPLSFLHFKRYLSIEGLGIFAERFHYECVSRRNILSADNIYYILALGTAILKVLTEIENVTEIQSENIMANTYSALNAIFSDVIIMTINDGYRDKLASLLTDLHTISKRVKTTCDPRNECNFEKYVDLLYKYYLICFPLIKNTTYPDMSLLCEMLEYSITVNRYFNRNRMFLEHVPQWWRKIADLKTLQDVLRLSDPRETCSICFKPVPVYDMSILANCNHIFCTNCLLMKINSTDEGYQIISFTCPNSNCNEHYRDFVRSRFYEELHTYLPRQGNELL